MRTLVGAILVALVFALAFAACERIVVLTPFPGDGGYDSAFVPDAAQGFDGGSHFDGGHFPDAFVPLD